jgi:hypothetical protein
MFEKLLFFVGIPVTCPERGYFPESLTEMHLKIITHYFFFPCTSNVRKQLYYVPKFNILL